jgi:multidrug efflux pump subunit AcrA (membrane-fusion protein)
MNDTGKPNLSDLKIDQQARSSDGGGRRLMLIAAAVLVTIAVIAILIFGGTSVTTVEVANARAVPAGGAATVLNASGYVEPRRKATVSAKITGKVTEVLVDEGMVVEEGQVLARLDDSDARRPRRTGRRAGGDRRARGQPGRRGEDLATDARAAR